MKLSIDSLLGFITLLLCPFVIYSQGVQHFEQSIETEGRNNIGIYKRSNISAIKQYASDLFILSKRGGCYRFNEARDTAFQALFIPENRKDFFNDFYYINKQLFTWTNGNRLAKIDLQEDNKISFIPFATTFFSKTINPSCMAMNKAETIFVGAPMDGVFMFPKNEQGTYNYTPQHLATPQLPSNQVNCLYQDTKDRIWVGTAEGIALIDQDTTYNLSETKYSPQTTIQKAFDIKIEAFSFHPAVHAITKWGNTMILASDDDIYKVSLIDGQLKYIHKYNLSEQLETPLSGIKKLYVDIDSQLWILGNQLIRYNITQDKITNVGKEQKIHSQSFHAIAEDLQKDIIWIGTEKNGLYKLPYSLLK